MGEWALQQGLEGDLTWELPLRLVMAARSQGEPDGQAAKWSDRRTDGQSHGRAETNNIHR